MKVSNLLLQAMFVTATIGLATGCTSPQTPPSTSQPSAEVGTASIKPETSTTRIDPEVSVPGPEAPDSTGPLWDCPACGKG